MDNIDLEKNELLASIRLQEEALSVSVANTSNFITCDSDSDGSQNEIGVDIANIKDDDVEDNELDPDENVQPTWADALSANMEYDEALAKVEEDMKQNIERIEKELTNVRKKISRLSDEMSSFNAKGHWLYIFGMPYFKDSNFYPCPTNQDYLVKKANREICWSDLPLFHQWVPSQKRNLVGAIKKLSLQRCETKARVKLKMLQKDLEAARTIQDTEKVTALEDQIGAFNIVQEANSMLQDAIENDEHDWMQISAKYLLGKQSPDGCRSFWLMYMHPKINKGPWTSDEECRLKKIAKKYNVEDWDSIAEELGTKRSGYQCFIIYHTKLNDALKRNVWTVEEDEKLLNVIERCRIGDYIPWGKVAFNLDGRTKTQVFNRWTYSLNPSIKKGRFTSAEDIMILVGVNMWGENFQRIANFMKDRTTCQVRDRFKNYLSRQGNAIPWAVQDDERLFSLVKSYGRNWAKISEHFPSKDRTQVRHRFNTISKWREANPDLPLNEAPVRRHNSHSGKDFSAQWEKARAILSCETIDDMVVAKEQFVSTFRGSKKRTKPTKKRTSLVEADMINYFRCCYDLPAGRRRYQLRAGEADKYSDELINLIQVFNVQLNLPISEEIQSDHSLTQADKDILSALQLKIEAAAEKKDSPPKSPESFSSNHPYGIYTDEDLHCGENSCLLLDQAVPSSSFVESSSLSTSSIDYVGSHCASSVYIDLPLLNFQKDEVIVQKKVTIDAASGEDMDFLFVDTNMDNSSTVNDMNNVMTKKPEELYVCPSNFTNLVGLRTYLLNRRTLVEWSNQNHSNVRRFSDVKSPKIKSALDLFNKRLLSLFMWPALMSRIAPSENQIFFEVGEKPPRLNAGLFHSSKRKAPQENQPTDTVHQACSKSTECVSEPSTSGRSRKRQRLCPSSGKLVLEAGGNQKDLTETHQSYSVKENPSKEQFSGVAPKDSNTTDTSSQLELCEIAGGNIRKAHCHKIAGDSKIDFCEIPAVNNINFDESSLGAVTHEQLCSSSGKFVSGSDISLASVQEVLVENIDNSTLSDIQMVELLDSESYGFLAENSSDSELLKPLRDPPGNLNNLGRLCPSTGRFASDSNLSIKFGEDMDEDPDEPEVTNL